MTEYMYKYSWWPRSAYEAISRMRQLSALHSGYRGRVLNVHPIITIVIPSRWNILCAECWRKANRSVWNHLRYISGAVDVISA